MSTPLPLPKGRRGEFARVIVSRLPEEIDFKEAALLIGCTESSAAQQGHTWAKRPDVIAYVSQIAKQRGIQLKRWRMPENAPTPSPDLLDNEITPVQICEYIKKASIEQLPKSSLKEIEQLVNEKLDEDAFITPQKIINYLRTASIEQLHGYIYEIANLACERVGITGTPEQIAEMIMKNPATKPETKLSAARTLMKQQQPEKTPQKQTESDIPHQDIDLYSPYAQIYN